MKVKKELWWNDTDCGKSKYSL